MRETYQIWEDRRNEDQEKEDVDDTGYWSSDDLPLEEAEEVTDSYFYDHLFDKNDWESPPEENLPTSDYDLKSPPENLKSPPEHLKSPPEDVISVNDQLKSPSGRLEGTEADGDIFEDTQQLGDVVSPIMFSPVQECTDTGICIGPNHVERCFLHNIFH